MHPYLYQGAQQQQQQQQQPLPQSFNQQDFYGAAAGGQPLQPPTSMAGYQQMMAMQQQQQQQHHHQRQASNQMTKDEEKIFSLVQDVLNPDLRENALLELSKRRETFEDLAPILWYSYGKFYLRRHYCMITVNYTAGVIAVLLQEVVSIFPYLSPPTLSTQLSNRVCNTLALLQCVASHPDTRGPCLSGKY
jgi:CCR4-NOT transcription complex subunit 9